MATDHQPIVDALSRLYDQEGVRIVFWHDPEGQFADFVAGRMLPIELGTTAVTVVDLTPPRSDLALKLRIEREEPNTKFLLYAPFEEPEYENDWLLDIRLAAIPFRADRASIHLQDLGLASLDLREHLDARRKFLDAKERLDKLRKLVEPRDDATALDLKMMAVTLKAEQPEYFVLLRTLFNGFLEGTEDKHPDLDAPPPLWRDLTKYNLADTFWAQMKGLFGYQDATPTLKKLLVRLLVTDLRHGLSGEPPPALVGLGLPRDKAPNVVACLAQWRDNSRHSDGYDALSQVVGEELKLEGHLAEFPTAALIDVMTFQIVERCIVRRLRDRVLAVQNEDHVQEVRAIALRRQAGHWATRQVSPSELVPRDVWSALYDAMVAAAELFALKVQAQAMGFGTDSPAALYQAYGQELFRFDQVYRHFHEGADQVRKQGWDILKAMQDQVEAVYLNDYLKPLAMAWDGWLEGADSLLSTWRLPDVLGQTQFWDEHVAPRMDGRSRTFVIISDAFRYEAAQELASELKGRYRMEADLSSCLGALPSITSLGMASLLPHKTLAIGGDGNPLADGLPTGSLEQRGKVLQASSGIACKAEDLMAMKKDDGRAFVEGAKVVYVYHNLVDATGDKADSEEDTFQAVRESIGYLGRLVSHIFNNLNGNHVLITADHGFLFTVSDPGETEKSKLGGEIAGAFPNKAKKRYVMGQGLPASEVAFHGKVAHLGGDAEFLVPKGIQRFHLVGGARFFHGGASLQEVVVPVITVRHKKGGAASKTQTRHVQVHVLGSSHKITAARHRFELIQTDPVSERVKAITLKIAIYEAGETTPLSNVQNLTFDSDSDNLDQRKKQVLLTISHAAYNKQANYRLVLLDADSGIEHESIPVTIERAFTDDF